MIANYNLLTLGIKSFAILDNEKKVFQRMQDQVEIENSFKYYRRSVSVLFYQLNVFKIFRMTGKRCRNRRRS
jgi:hypothetical protein